MDEAVKKTEEINKRYFIKYPPTDSWIPRYTYANLQLSDPPIN